MQRLTLIIKRRLWAPGGWLLGSLLSLAASSIPVCLADAHAPFPGTLTLQDGAITAHIVATPLRQVLEEVSRLSGAQVLWLHNERGEEPVSVEFTDLPVSEALSRVLGERDFLLFYTATGRKEQLTQIWISSHRRSQPTRKLQPGAARQMRPSPAGDHIPRAQETATEEGSEYELGSLPLATLMQAAVHEQDPTARLAAITALAARAQEDRNVPGILTHIARNDPNPHVQEAAAEALAGLE